MAMAESRNECEIMDADIAMDLIQSYGVEITDLEVYYLTLSEEQRVTVNKYIQEREGQFTQLLKHDDDLNEESIVKLISQLSAKEAFEWAETTGRHNYKALVGKSLSKDASELFKQFVSSFLTYLFLFSNDFCSCISFVTFL